MKKKISSGEMKQILREKLGSYNPSNLDLNQFVGKVDKAIARAKKLDVDAAERWPSSTGTHVYKVVKKVKRIFPSCQNTAGNSIIGNFKYKGQVHV